MNAELITIGDEILIGQIVDSNSAFMGKELTKIGIEVRQIKTIGDDRSAILHALETAKSHADLVIFTGGLGPTKDDITKKTLTDFLDDHLVENQLALANVKRLFAQIGEPVLPVNLDQAKIPSRATALQNVYGTAPGMWVEKYRTVFVFLPGVPYEMKALMQREVLPRLRQKFNRPFILHKTVLTYGMGESRVAQKLEAWENALPQNMKLAYLPRPGRVRLRLTARGGDREKLKNALNGELKKLHDLIGDNIHGYEGEGSLEEEIAALLTRKEKTLATVESCTGGMIANRLTQIPGASAYFKGSLVPYATALKTDILGVPREKITTYSVVSAEVAEAMAVQGQKMFKTDLVLATTGNAGPTKGNSDAEVGTVFIALADGKNVETREFHLGKSREKVTGKAVYRALKLLLDEIC